MQRLLAKYILCCLLSGKKDSTWKYLVPEEVLVDDVLDGPREDEVGEVLIVLLLPLPLPTFLLHLFLATQICRVRCNHFLHCESE